ncbi:hypothetical protein [Portibacter lacus]|uniref:DUF4412 domain-containing protein n=1 Tax=Portibacter lacus TaxID=1099794 RepID=A0AA37SNT7_9BACT|nr:hypothetical protein [Portibacter lacus]GLR16717.1 hypothetical protein GCM10007940_13320 [Portibacter lacus]
MINNKIMNIKSIVTLLFLFSLAFTSNAQIDLSKIARDAKKTVNKRVDRNIDRAIDNTLDETEDVIRGKKKKKRGKNADKDDDIYYEGDGEARVIKEVNPNSFKGQFLITRDVEGAEDQSNMYTIAMQDYETVIRPLMVKKPHNLIIYNKQDETQTTINNEMYNGKALRDWISLGEEDSKKKLAVAERTDDIETIGGYIARKYIIDHRDYEGEIWFTKEIDADISVINNLLELDDLYLEPGLGFPLRMNLIYDDERTVNFAVTDIKEEADKALFDISNYQLVDMTDLEVGN